MAPSLAPDDAAAAAWAISHCDGALASAGKAAVTGGGSAALDDALRAMDWRICHEYLAGASFSTADAVCLPFLWRVRLELSVPAECAALNKYLDHALSHPSFSRTVSESWWWWW